ncbi:type II toxin-antitoxin system RelE family toxin [Arabiibacter massiliensis]|uniref:type II toxin-antitoxin system RelE family toxin n=1 Tax=Arabiibacter massiliensis TaxID=1870985 RepID=UPI0009B9F3CE|nr:type II toxin-antitoxin system RelE/ParE family toxin [Arabiibacter massiliensis]
MDYEVEFEHSALLDLKQSTFYEVQFTFSVERSKERMHEVMERTVQALSALPARNSEKAYGFTETLRRKLVVGKYAAFYWIDEESSVVHVERILHSKADFSRIHFGN